MTRRKKKTKKRRRSGARRKGVSRPCTHEWVVFSTALDQGWLMVQCVTCGAMGTVNDPTEEEWAAAFHAPSTPYRWDDNSRVTLRRKDFDVFHVVRSDSQPSCECAANIEGLGHPGYERIPIEIAEHSEVLEAKEKDELLVLAEWVGTTDLCSRLFPLFVHKYQQHTGNELPGAVRRVTKLIEYWDECGHHLSPKGVARLLVEYAHAKPVKAPRRPVGKREPIRNLGKVDATGHSAHHRRKGTQ
jgi:hypothetical protein